MCHHPCSPLAPREGFCLFCFLPETWPTPFLAGQTVRNTLLIELQRPMLEEKWAQDCLCHLLGILLNAWHYLHHQNLRGNQTAQLNTTPLPLTSITITSFPTYTFPLTLRDTILHSGPYASTLMPSRWHSGSSHWYSQV